MRMTRADMKRLQEEHVAAETRKDLAGAMAGYLEDCYYQNVRSGFASGAASTWPRTISEPGRPSPTAK
jgi:hypothetical protein